MYQRDSIRHIGIWVGSESDVIPPKNLWDNLELIM